MKTLYLVRHAKSSWEYDLEDHQRPLNERGLSDAPLMAAHIKDFIKRPGRIVSSDAVRAKTTALLYLKGLGIPESEMKLEHKLYDFSGKGLQEVIKSCPDDIDCQMLFGHNHAMTNMVNKLGDEPIGNVSTAAFTAIEFDTDSWSSIEEGKTTHYIKPKHLK